MHKYNIIHTRSTYTNVHRYVTSGNVYVTGYRITPVMQGQLSPMNDAYITGNALPDILILYAHTAYISPLEICQRPDDIITQYAT